MINKAEEKIKQFANFVEKNHKIFFIIILALALFLNLYRFGQVPEELNVDEAGMNYDAYCLANYGVDRFCKKLPVYCINYGDGQNVLYTYLNALLIKICGTYNMVIMRMPSLILSIIEVSVSYLLVKEFKSKKEALLFMFLVTISPWHIMKSRWGLESYLLSPMLLFSIYSLIKAVKAQKQKLLKFCISGVLLGLTLYTYAIAYIVVPLFLLLMLIYLIDLKKIKLKEVIVFSVPLIILAIPLILMIMVQKGIIEEIDSFITIPKMFFYRGGEVSLKNINEHLSTLKFVLVNDYLNYNSIKGFGTLYYFGTVFMLVGIIIALIKLLKEERGKKEDKAKKNATEMNLDLIMLMAFTSNIIFGFLTNLNANRLNGIFISATYFELVTLRVMYKNIKTIFCVLIAVYIIAFILFIKTYFTDFVKTKKPYHDNGAVELMRYLQRFESKEIHAENIKYTYNLFVNPISPYEFNETKTFAGVHVTGYKNYDSNEIDIYNCEIEAVYVTQDEYKAILMLRMYDFEMEIYNNKYYILYKE